MSEIAIIDYGVGNLRSVEKGIEHVGGNCKVINSPDGLSTADKIVLPGVGAFGYAMDKLKQAGFIEPLKEMISKDVPLLGICLGKQLLVDASEESPDATGLGCISGKVVRFPEGEKVPHIGWNQVSIVEETPLLRGVPDGSYFYFVHSYFAQPHDGSHVVATSDYGSKFPCIIAKGNVFGVQFHPEKSQEMGLLILKNYVEL
jgi:imidazole glycerol-phosphate synthase subunit HisH